MDDLVVLGNAAPDEIHDGRKTVCTVCYSDEHGLVRIYHVPPGAPMKRWNIVSVPLVRTTRDTRQESWKIQGSRDEWPRLTDKIRLVGQVPQVKRRSLTHMMYEKFGVGCVQNLNKDLLSLGMVKPIVFGEWMKDRENTDDTIQSTLDSDILFQTIRNYKKQPRVKYVCQECTTTNGHDQQIIEWGLYEFMRKNPEQPEGCLDGLHLMDRDYEKHFLVGNLAKHRNSFVVVSVFRFKR